MEPHLVSSGNKPWLAKLRHVVLRNCTSFRNVFFRYPESSSERIFCSEAVLFHPLLALGDTVITAWQPRARTGACDEKLVFFLWLLCSARFQPCMPHKAGTSEINMFVMTLSWPEKPYLFSLVLVSLFIFFLVMASLCEKIPPGWCCRHFHHHCTFRSGSKTELFSEDGSCLDADPDGAYTGSCSYLLGVWHWVFVGCSASCSWGLNLALISMWIFSFVLALLQFLSHTSLFYCYWTGDVEKNS